MDVLVRQFWLCRHIGSGIWLLGILPIWPIIVILLAKLGLLGAFAVLLALVLVEVKVDVGVFKVDVQGGEHVSHGLLEEGPLLLLGLDLALFDALVGWLGT